jgi:hypothetical protein
MKKMLLIAAALVVVAGCAVEKSYFGSSTTVGLQIGVDEQKIPTVRMGYIRAEGGAVNNGQRLTLEREFRDISLLTGKGSGNQKIEFRGDTVRAD